MPTWEWLKGYYKKTTTKWTMKLIKLCPSTNHRPAFPAEKLITDLKMEKNSFLSPIWLKTQPNIAIWQQPLSEAPLNHNFPSQKDPLAPPRLLPLSWQSPAWKWSASSHAMLFLEAIVIGQGSSGILDGAIPMFLHLPMNQTLESIYVYILNI